MSAAAGTSVTPSQSTDTGIPLFGLNRDELEFITGNGYFPVTLDFCHTVVKIKTTVNRVGCLEPSDCSTHIKAKASKWVPIGYYQVLHK